MTMLLLSATAALGAGSAAYFGNRVLLGAFGRIAMVLAVPWWEEACKTVGFALLPGASVLLIHLLFGCMELTYDVMRSRTNGRFLGALSLVSHGLIGSVAAFGLSYTVSLAWMYAFAGLTHCLLNAATLRFVLPSLGADPQVHLDKW